MLLFIFSLAIFEIYPPFIFLSNEMQDSYSYDQNNS